MSDRVTLYLPTLPSHRARRTLSLPAREKPIIPPVISETPEVKGEQQSEEEQQIYLEANYDGYHDEIRK